MCSSYILLNAIVVAMKTDTPQSVTITKNQQAKAPIHYTVSMAQARNCGTNAETKSLGTEYAISNAIHSISILYHFLSFQE